MGVGFFVDINLFKANKERAAEIAKNNNIDGNVNDRAKDGLADDDANLMIKLKFLTYKVCALQHIFICFKLYQKV
jgi:hypothetical protein